MTGGGSAASPQRRTRPARTLIGLIALAAVAVLLTVQPWDRHARTVVTTPAPYVDELPPPPAPFPGGGDGCEIEDPTGTGGCVTPATAWLLGELETAFGELSVSCWSEHSWNPTSDHPAGRACDLFPGRAGVLPSEAEAARGWHLAEWARENAAALGVDYIIWWGRIWAHDRPGRGWAPYDGAGVYDPDDPTGGHYDHVHISMQEDL